MSHSIARFAARHIKGSPAVLACRRMARGYANTNYRLDTTAGVFLLRHRLLQKRAAVEYEINVHGHLRRSGFPAPAVLPFAADERWLAAPDDTHLVLLEWIDGHHPRPCPSSVTAIARALARLHRLPPPAGDWWRRPSPIGLGAAMRLAADAARRKEEIFRFFIEELEQLGAAVETPLPHGLIHGDVFPDNTLYGSDGQLRAVLDFEDACQGAFLFDLAMTIHGFCFPGESWSPGLAALLIESYDAGRPLSRPERKLLPDYLRWCPLAMMGWHLRQLLRSPNRQNENRAVEFMRRIQSLKTISRDP